MLPDGTYDAIVVDAGAADGGTGTVIELTLVAGDHKGEVVAMIAAALGGAVGLPAAALAPVVAIVLSFVSEVGVNAWCKLSVSKEGAPASELLDFYHAMAIYPIAL